MSGAIPLKSRWIGDGAHDSPCGREKIMKRDAKRREYDIVVIGEEAHLAYNRVGLTSFFQHRNVENLYLNPKEWVFSSLPMCRVGIDQPA